MAEPGMDGFSTATAMLRALRARQVSARELLGLCRRRIECYNPQLNAIVVPCLDRAQREAEAADAARARGEVSSDIGGSIRVPAAFCGVYGHRPSDSALPKSGQFPFPPIPNPLTIMGVQGPLARSADAWTHRQDRCAPCRCLPKA